MQSQPLVSPGLRCRTIVTSLPDQDGGPQLLCKTGTPTTKSTKFLPGSASDPSSPKIARALRPLQKPSSLSLLQKLARDLLAEREDRAGHGHFLSQSPHHVSKSRTFLELFFALWFVMGNVWVFYSRIENFEQAPNLHILCVSLLAWNAISYTFPFLLFLLLCCVVPLVSNVLGYNMNLGSVDRGASDDQISQIPKWRFKEIANGNSVATVLAIYGNWEFARISGIGWGWAEVIRAYTIVTYFPLDILKFMIHYGLSGKARDNRLQNKIETSALALANTGADLWIQLKIEVVLKHGSRVM